MTVSRRNTLVLGALIGAALLGAVALAVATRGSDRSPTAAASPAAHSPTPTAVAAVPLASLGLPEDCHPFDQGGPGAPLEAGAANTIRFRAAHCAIPALDAVAASGRGIETV